MADHRYHWYSIVMQSGEKGKTITTSSLIGRAVKCIPESVPEDTIQRMGLDPNNTVFLNAFYRGYMTRAELAGEGRGIASPASETVSEALRGAAERIRAGSKHASPEGIAKMIETMASEYED